jgi:hypothetical protein
MSQSILRGLLARFLKGEDIGKYPVVQTRIISLSPLQVTDDFKFYIDMSSVEDRVTEDLGDKVDLQHVLILQDWKFVLRRIPNSHEYFFDLSVNNYKLKEVDSSASIPQELTKMEDDDEIRYLFEVRKRNEIGRMNKAMMNQAPKESPDKMTMTKADTIAATSAKQSEIKGLIPSLTAIEFQKELLKTSTAKTEGKKSPLHLENSFFKKAGILSANQKISSSEETFFLSISDLMSVPVLIPQVKRSVIRFMQPIKLRRSPSSDSKLDEANHESLGNRDSSGQNHKRSSHDHESSETRRVFKFEEIHNYLRLGNLKWSQLIFSRASFTHLKENSQILTDF